MWGGAGEQEEGGTVWAEAVRWNQELVEAREACRRWWPRSKQQPVVLSREPRNPHFLAVHCTHGLVHATRAPAARAPLRGTAHFRPQQPVALRAKMASSSSSSSAPIERQAFSKPGQAFSTPSPGSADRVFYVRGGAAAALPLALPQAQHLTLSPPPSHAPLPPPRRRRCWQRSQRASWRWTGALSTAPPLRAPTLAP
jgi:hypothetical protein